MKSFFVAVVLALPAFAADAGSPAEAAVRFVEKLRANELDLAPGKDTALSPVTGQDKRKQISEQLKRLGRELGASKVEAGTQKVEGDMAAVLLHQATGFDPARLRVIPIGLIRKNENWIPAPVPGSFENTGLGYDASRSERLAALEAWMMTQQVTELATLRDQTATRLREAIGSKITKEDLHNSTPEKVTKRFLAACAARDQASMLGLIGGLQKELPKDWSTRVAAVDQAFARNPLYGPWRQLISPGVVRTLISVDGDSTHAVTTLACLDASGEVGRELLPQIHLLDLELQQDPDGLWRVDLPANFLNTVENKIPNVKEAPEIEEEQLKEIVKAWQRDHPPVPAASLEAAREALLKALSSPEPDALLSLANLNGDPATAVLGVTRLALIWRDLHHPRDVRTPLPLDLHQEGEGGVLAFQLFSSREPDREDTRQFYFSKTPEGWLLIPGLRPAEKPEPVMVAVKAWANQRAPEWTSNWMALALANSTSLAEIPAGEGPTEDAARSAFNTWNSAITNRNIAGTIGMTAWLNRGDGANRLLRNIGAELTGATKVGRSATVLGMIRRGAWTAVSARIGRVGDDETTYPLYLLVTTPAGPRILAGIDLLANGNRTRDFLNEATFQRLETGGDGDSVASLKEIYEIHRKNAEADRAPAPSK